MAPPPRRSPRGRSSRSRATAFSLRHVSCGASTGAGAPVGAVVATSLAASLGLLLGLDSAAVGSLIAFGTAGIYVAFLLVALAALVARLRGTWVPDGLVRRGRLGVAINAAAVGWLAFETVNIAWPRASLAPPGAPAYQVWAAVIVLAAIAAIGGIYLLVARPQRRLADR